MANFRTHITGSAISSGLLSSTLSVSGIFNLYEVAVLWVVGAISGILPDIDSDQSRAHSALFGFFGILAAMLCIALFSELPLLHLWALMFSSFIFSRYVLSSIFAYATVHRGIYHSILAAISFSLLGGWISLKYFDCSGDFAWAMAISILCGYLTHLILDELYSVDLNNYEIKRSFGTALKPLSLKNSLGSFTLIVIIFFCYRELPTPLALKAVIFSTENKSLVLTRLEALKQSNDQLLTSIQHKFNNAQKNQ